MPDNALDFCDNGAKVFGTVRHRDVHQFFDRATIREVVVHGTHIIEAISVRNELVIGPFLGQLFHPAMEKAHHRRRFDQSFSLQLKNDLQHSMGAGMLRTHV
jgi:hypothetical protein